jgi:DNA-binding transcriptional MerR regulator
VSEERYSIGELAERAGVSRRTVRFYVQRGLLPAPLGRGRGEHYDATHLTAVGRIKALQLAGASLEDIRSRLSPDPAPTPPDTPQPTPGAGGGPVSCPLSPVPRAGGGRYIRQTVLPGVELHLSEAHPPLSESQLAALAAFLNELSRKGDEE